MNISRRSPVRGFITLLCLITFVSFAAKDKKRSEEKKTPVNYEESVFNWSRTFAEVLEKTDQKHYKVSDPESCMIHAIDGFLSCLDPHSGFLDPKTYKAMLESTSGEFFGIGIVIDNTRQTKDKFLLIVDTIAGGPADTAGVKPLDKIVEINGQLLEGMSTEEATTKLKGERHTVVTIKVIRENMPDMLTFEIKRDVIKEQSSLCFALPDQNIYYLSLSSFTDNAVKQLEKLLLQAQKQHYKALVLDLRNNSGGLLSSAIDIAGLFIDKGSLVVTTKDKHQKETERYETSRSPIAGTLPIFILINNYTASAAEILAGGLKIHSDKMAKENPKQQKRLMVFLVGTRTFGKGSVQEVIPVSNNCAIKITTSLYYLPDNITIQGLGIEPDFVVEKRLPLNEQMVWFNKNYGSERTLSNYIKSHAEMEKEKEEEAKKEKDTDKKKTEKEKTWSERAKETLEKDNQFRETITLINILSTAQTNCPTNVSNRHKAVEYINKIYVGSESLKLEEVKI